MLLLSHQPEDSMILTAPVAITETAHIVSSPHPDDTINASPLAIAETAHIILSQPPAIIVIEEVNPTEDYPFVTSAGSGKRKRAAY